MINNHPSGTVAIVAHDAGGAAILASYIRRKNLNYLPVLSGPAKSIFQDRFGFIRTVSLQQALQSCSWVLTGTGQTNFEHEAIYQARTYGKFVASYLDHWVNYSKRFIRNGVVAYPNEIWVGDSYAANIARSQLPGHKLRSVPNPYFKDFIEHVKRISSHQQFVSTGPSRVLYVSENIKLSSFNQADAFRFFMNNLNAFSDEIGEIVYRPHPSESIETSFTNINAFAPYVSLSKHLNLANDVAQSDIVVGCTSMALVLSAFAGRRVVSFIPNNQLEFTLPFRQIEHFSNLS